MARCALFFDGSKSVTSENTHTTCDLTVHNFCVGKSCPELQHYKSDNMAPNISRPHAVDPEWANSLVGLRMKVPISWWPGFSGNEGCDGKITETKLKDQHNRFWLLELDNEPGDFYPMRYDAVCLYVDTSNSNLRTYHLPQYALVPPGEEQVQFGRKRRQKKRQKTPRNSAPSEVDEEKEDDDTNKSSSSYDDGGDDDADNDADDTEEPNIYTRTDPSEWEYCGKLGKGRIIKPIPYTGVDELFSINITEEELESLKDSVGNIQFHKIAEWGLPRFGEQSMFSWMAARIAIICSICKRITTGGHGISGPKLD